MCGFVQTGDQTLAHILRKRSNLPNALNVKVFKAISLLSLMDEGGLGVETGN